MAIIWKKITLPAKNPDKLTEISLVLKISILYKKVFTTLAFFVEAF